MNKLCFSGLLLVTGVLTMQAQDFSLYLEKQFIKGKDTMPYRLLLPENYNPAREYPLLFFMHGAGKRGNDNQQQLERGAELFLRDSVRKKYPAIIAFPQCSEESFWSNVIIQTDSTGKKHFTFTSGGNPTKAMQLAQQLLYNLCRTYPVNRKRVYAGGLSMGGMGTFELVNRNPRLFAAAIAICGGAHPSTASAMKHTNWWIFHGAKDNVVDIDFSREMAASLKAAGADVKFTIYPDANHNSWDSAFAEPGLLPWLFAQEKL